MNVKDAVHATVRSYPGGSEALAPRVGMTPGVLRNKANPNSDTHRLAIEEASEIMGVTGDYRILHALAAEHGFVCTGTAAEQEKPGSVMQTLLSMRVSDGALSTVLHSALADGRVSPNEMKHISAAIQKLMFELLKLDAACEQQTLRDPAMK